MKTIRLSPFLALFRAAGLTPASAQNYTFTTLAGAAGSSGRVDGTGSAARFNAPFGVAVDGSGNVFVGDAGNHTIRKITAAGVVTTLAGMASTSGSADGTGNAARFNRPCGVAVDASGNVYVVDSRNHTIRKGVPVAATETSRLVSLSVISVAGASATLARCCACLSST